MAQVLTFDTLDYANKLKEVGLSPKIADKQAELQAKILKDLTQEVATKADLLATKADLKVDLVALEKDLRGDMARLELRLLTRLGGIVVGCSAILGVLITMVR